MACLVPLLMSAVQSLKGKLETIQQSRAGQFFKKISDDELTNLAALIAWNTLSTILPLLLGILALAGLVLRDPTRLDQVYNALLAVLPANTTSMLSPALDSVQHQAAGPAGIIGVVLLLINGSSFFSNLENVFDRAYHVPMRNVVMQRVVGLIMLLVVTALLLLSITALGIGGLIGSLPLGLPVGPVLGRVVSWSISAIATLLMFLLVYRVIPNAKQGWRAAVPGTVLSVVAFFVILMVFPLYVKLFPPNQAYATFGIFLVLMFWLYLLGITFVLGVEINAFLLEPNRAVALAEATNQAQQGQAQVQAEGGQVEAHTTGKAPSDLQGAAHSGGAVSADVLPSGAQNAAPASNASSQNRGGLGGRVIGLIGLVLAAVLLRGRTASSDSPRAAAADS